MAALCLVSSIYLFYKRKDSQNKAINDYFAYFILFFLYNAFLVFPLIAFDELNIYGGFFYAAAMSSLCIMIWHGFRLSLTLLGLKDFSRRFLSSLYFLGATIVIVLHFVFIEVPVGSENGKWVFWHTNQSLARSYDILVIIVLSVFIYAMMKGFFVVDSGWLKLRSILLALAGILTASSAFYYFGATKIEHIYLAFVCAISGLLLFAFGNILIGIFNKNLSQ